VNKKFKKHMEEILYEQEKALMPATQPIIEEMIRKKHIREELSKLDEEIAKLARERRLLEATIYNPNLDKTKETQKTSFMRSCAAEGCRGFLSSQWKCGICELWTCPDCHELKGENRDDPDHKCDPNNVETAKLLNSDTKPCPKCQTKIFARNVIPHSVGKPVHYQHLFIIHTISNGCATEEEAANLVLQEM
jgi:hypothetical protein